MYECQILVRLKNTTIQNKYGKQYGNCQVCNEKYSQYCIEASQSIKGRNNILFIFCYDCYLVVNDICSKFVYNKKIYNYDGCYHLNDENVPIQIKQPIPIHSFSNFEYTIPFIIGNKLIF